MIREVYVKVNTEVVNNTPVKFVEFKKFWKNNKSDKNYVMIYVNENNKIVQ